jgi:hypothetical protein
MKLGYGVFFVLGLVVLPSVSARAVTPIVIDFESFPGMGFSSGFPIPVASRLSNQLLATDGVLFSSGAPYVPVLNLGAGHAVSGTNGIGGSTAAGTLTYNSASPITISFWDPQHTANVATTDFVSVKGDLDSIVGPSATLSAYGLQNQLLGSVFHIDAPGQDWTISAQGIYSVIFSGVSIPDGTAGGIALDDLTFNPVTVPEPGTIGVMCFGVALASKRRRNAETFGSYSKV